MNNIEHSPTSFTQVYNHITFSTTLSAKARILYIALASHAYDKDTVWPSQQRLAEMVGCSARHIRTLMKELVAEGLVRIIRRGYWKRATEYLLTAIVSMRKSPDAVQGKPTTAQEYKPNNSINNRANRRFERKGLDFERLKKWENKELSIDRG